VQADAVPPFIRLAAHPIRWRLLRELARSDLRVGELCELVGERQSLVSYHLRQMREDGVVSARRSLADGRDAYYVLDLAACTQRMTSAGFLLHPGLATAARRDRPASAHVLFLCTGNSARSRMAEALIEHLSSGAVTAASAGSRPKPLHPDAARVMHERGIDLADRPSRHLSELAATRFDYVVTLCDRVREVCPEFPGAPPALHWSIRDPAAEGGAAFERTAEELTTRISFLLEFIADEQEVATPWLTSS
jgi:ArsR family transcriptional regulator, arsenate/arsenite/antimonite-responsive transcriptional repressor / arsenate reductase (thioredoxin)